MEAPRNALLASLPRETYLRLTSALAPVTLAFGEILQEPDAPIEHVYFPGSCLVSLLSVVDAHAALEVGMVGREGMVGVSLALDADASPMRALVQGEGHALRMPRARFLAVLGRSPPLRRAVNRYADALIRQIAVSAGCNRFHFVKPRLARWLLMTRDRVGSAEFRMTHGFLSAMLGVRRVGVTEAASALQRDGLIEYRRGRIHVLDRARLEEAACSCYRRQEAPRGEPREARKPSLSA